MDRQTQSYGLVAVKDFLGYTECNQSFKSPSSATTWRVMHRYGLGCCPQNHLPWDELKHLLNIEFGASQYDDFLGGDLTRLQQIGMGKDYKKQFSRLLAQAGFMTEAQRMYVG